MKAFITRVSNALKLSPVAFVQVLSLLELAIPSSCKRECVGAIELSYAA